MIRAWRTFPARSISPNVLYARHKSSLITSSSTPSSSTLETTSPNVPVSPSTIKSAHSRLSSNKWAKLIKLDLSALVCVTSAGGYIFTGGSLFDITTFLGLLTGTMLSAASASAFNQIIEQKFDSMMQRTRTRPLVANSISTNKAAAFGVIAGGCGVGLLYITTNPTTAFLSLLTIGTYTNIYTPLKRITRFNTEVGALVGAIPPVMGWTAAMGSSGVLTSEALFLAATLYAWQMHHFMTIAWTSRTDYARAGFIMQSLNDPTGYKTATKGLFWAGTMFTLPVISTYIGFTNPMFLLTGTLTNAYLFRSYLLFYKTRTNRDARSARIAGFLQLLAFFGFLTFHLQDREHIKGFKQLEEMRVEGKKFCVYHYHKFMQNSHFCVYLFGHSQKDETNSPTFPDPVVSTGIVKHVSTLENTGRQQATTPAAIVNSTTFIESSDTGKPFVSGLGPHVRELQNR